MDDRVTPRSVPPDPRWAQLLARDASADVDFCYAVTTTGIYCRPSCPARRPNPKNVRFYPTAEAAAAAGFRPCKRCRPGALSLRETQTAMVLAACRQIERADEMPALAALAHAAGASPAYFHRVFKEVTGLTPRAFGAARRAERLRTRLTTSPTVTAALYEAGFNAASRFYEKADALLGMTPAAYRRGGAGTEIRFAIGECSLGTILVAESVKGICAIFLGDDPATLLLALEDRFAAATLVGGDVAFEARVAAIVGFIEAPRLGLDLPLDVRGTVFQQRVWQALRAIPPGTTVSYSELARRIGAPKAVRAVAQACAANLLAVAIPCHRVVRSDGTLSGYRWGVARKRELLTREAAGR